MPVPIAASRALQDERTRALDVLCGALYATISGAAGHARDWRRHNELFVPSARLTIVHREPDGERVLESLTVPAYRASRESYFATNAFFESEVSREVTVCGDIAHVFSAFVARRTPDGEVCAQGVNSLQLLYAAGCWWIQSLMWEATTLAYALRTADLVRLTPFTATPSGGRGAPGK